MKIQLDTTSKTIKVEESVNLGELIEAVEKLLPNWKEYKIEPVIITSFVNPIVIDRWPVYPRRYPYWWQDQITVGGTLHYKSEQRLKSDITMQSNKSGIYNLQIN